MNFNASHIPDIINEIDQRFIDPDQFLSGNILVIKDKLDWEAKSKMSYREWILSQDSFPTLKLENFEDCPDLEKFIDPILYKYMNNVHVLKTNADGHSFDWHTDDLDVCLYVLQGTKTVEVPHHTYELGSADHYVIRKGFPHTVFSLGGTYAVTIGFTPP